MITRRRRDLNRAAVVLLLAAVAYQLLTAGVLKDSDQFVVITLNGLTLAALYFIVACGFTLVFGLMRVVNMAHGALYLLGGYIAFQIEGTSQGLGGPTARHSWWLAALAASAIVGALGLLIYVVLLRWTQGQVLRQALITIALSVIAADLMLAHFGGLAESLSAPAGLARSVTLPFSHIEYVNAFRLCILAMAAVIGLALWVWITRTRMGMIVRAGVDDGEMVSALGVNIGAVLAVTFTVGSALAGFGGAIGGTQVGLLPGQDGQFLLWSLAVVIIGGMGSLIGSAIGALVLGLVSSYAGVYLQFGDQDLTPYSLLLVFALMVGVLALRPQGLLGRAS